MIRKREYGTGPEAAAPKRLLRGSLMLVLCCLWSAPAQAQFPAVAGDDSFTSKGVFGRSAPTFWPFDPPECRCTAAENRRLTVGRE